MFSVKCINVLCIKCSVQQSNESKICSKLPTESRINFPSLKIVKNVKDEKNYSKSLLNSKAKADLSSCLFGP